MTHPPKKSSGTVLAGALRLFGKGNLLEAERFDIRDVPKQFIMLQVHDLRPGLYQTRRSFSKERQSDLAVSLGKTGVNMTPVIVRPVRTQQGAFEIISGERRWRAAQMVSIGELLCCVADFTDAQAMYISSADNIQREDLNPVEEAQAYELMHESGMTHQEIADDIGRSRAHVTNYLRLLELPFQVRDYITSERLSFAQARPLCGLTSRGAQIRIAKDAVAKKWSSKRVTQEVNSTAPKKRRSAQLSEGSSPDAERLSEMISEQTGYPCAVKAAPNGAWNLLLRAGSVDDFQGLLDRLGVSTENL